MPTLNSPTLSGDVSGKIYSITVDKIKGTPVSSTTPTNGQTLVFDGSKWVPSTTFSAGITGENARFTSVSATVFYGDGSQLTGITGGGTVGNYLSSSGGTLTGGLTGTNATFSLLSASKFYGDGSSLTGITIGNYLSSSGGTLTGGLTGTNATFSLLSASKFYGDGSSLTGLTVGNYLSSSGGTLTGGLTGTDAAFNFISAGDASFGTVSANGAMFSGSVVIADRIYQSYFGSSSLASFTTVGSVSAGNIYSKFNVHADAFYGSGQYLTNVSVNSIKNSTSTNVVSCETTGITLSTAPSPTAEFQWQGNNYRTTIPLEVWTSAVIGQSYFEYNGNRHYVSNKVEGAYWWENLIYVSTSIQYSNWPDDPNASFNYGPIVKFFGSNPPLTKVRTNGLFEAPFINSSSAVFNSLTANEYTGIKSIGTTNTSLLSCSQINNPAILIEPGAARKTAAGTSSLYNNLDIVTKWNTDPSSQTKWSFNDESLTCETHLKKKFVSFHDEKISINVTTKPNAGTILFEHFNYDILLYTQPRDIVEFPSSALSLNVVATNNQSYANHAAVGSVRTVCFINSWGSNQVTPTLSIDSVPQTIKWLGGNGQSSGINNVYDVWSFTIIRSDSSSYIVLGNVARYY